MTSVYKDTLFLYRFEKQRRSPQTAGSMFNGRLKITVIKAENLQQTNFMTRLNFGTSSDNAGGSAALDPYVAVDVDEVAVERTTTKVR